MRFELRGALLGASWSVLGRSWAVLERNWGGLRVSWGGPGASWGGLGASWSRLVGLCWHILIFHNFGVRFRVDFDAQKAPEKGPTWSPKLIKIDQKI